MISYRSLSRSVCFRKQLLDQFAVFGAGDHNLIIQPQEVCKKHRNVTLKLLHAIKLPNRYFYIHSPVTSSVCSVNEAKGMYGLLKSQIATTLSRKWEQLQRGSSMDRLVSLAPGRRRF